MSKDTKAILIGGLIFAAIIIGVTVFVTKNKNAGPGQLDAFATCLKDSGVTFYGAFWCPHCQAQKALFGSAQKKLPYVECSNPDGQTQNQTCNDKGIKGYPTWFFPDGTSQSGEMSLADLSAKSNCPLPSNNTSTMTATTTLTPGASTTINFSKKAI